jgi:hypothetical protein
MIPVLMISLCRPLCRTGDFWLCAPFVLGSLTRKTGRCAPLPPQSQLRCFSLSIKKRKSLKITGLGKNVHSATAGGTVKSKCFLGKAKQIIPSPFLSLYYLPLQIPPLISWSELLLLRELIKQRSVRTDRVYRVNLIYYVEI